jgi:hypothetical protein
MLKRGKPAPAVMVRAEHLSVRARVKRPPEN